MASTNPLLGGLSPRRFSQGRPNRLRTDVHATSQGSNNIFDHLMDHSRTNQGRNRLTDRSGGYSAYPPPPPITAPAKRGRSDIHGHSKRTMRPPALPRPKDAQIYGSPNNTVYGYQSEQLATASKAYAEQRRASPRNTSFKRYEQQRSVGQPMQPEIKNQGHFQPGPKTIDSSLHGGGSQNYQRELPKNPKHQSWSLQEKNLEKRSQNKISIFSGGVPEDNGVSVVPRRRGAALQNNNGRYFKPQYLDNNRISYPKDAPTFRRDGTIKQYDATKTNVLNGYSCFVKEHHDRAVRAQRRTLPRATNYRDFEKSSRDEVKFFTKTVSNVFVI